LLQNYDKCKILILEDLNSRTFQGLSSTFKHLICFQTLSRALKFLFQIQAFSRIFQARYEPWEKIAIFDFEYGHRTSLTMNVGSSTTVQAEALNELLAWRSIAVNTSLYAAYKCISCKNELRSWIQLNVRYVNDFC